MIVFFDTETKNLPDFNKRARDPSQPHIVQLAAILTEDDGKVVESCNFLVKPDGWTIPQEAIDVHGITNEYATEKGHPEEQVVSHFYKLLKLSQLMVAHNIQFDKFLARIALRRYDIFTDAEDEWWKKFPQFCTMKATTDICKLPSQYGRGFKWPKLSEAYQHIFQTELTGAHDALADVVACKDIYFWLKKRGN